MIRILLIYVLPLLAPSLLYLLWRLWQTKRRTGTVEGDMRGIMRRAPWVKLAAAGTALLALTLFIAALTGGEPAHEAYTPPHMENGKVVPGDIRRDAR
ncbi:MAG: DUF6111 family protein [Alphaproteobacteria bacterium]